MRRTANSSCLARGGFFFFSSRRRHTRCSRDWSSDVCSSDLLIVAGGEQDLLRRAAANLSPVTVVQPEGVNVRDLLLHDTVLIARRDLARLEIGRASCRERV